MTAPTKATCPLCGRRIQFFVDRGRPIFTTHLPTENSGRDSIITGKACDASGWIVEDADRFATKSTKPGFPTTRRRVCRLCEKSIAVDDAGNLVEHAENAIPPFFACAGSGKGLDF